MRSEGYNQVTVTAEHLQQKGADETGPDPFRGIRIASDWQLHLDREISQLLENVVSNRSESLT